MVSADSEKIRQYLESIFPFTTDEKTKQILTRTLFFCLNKGELNKP